MKGYEKYIKDVQSGKQITGLFIKQAVQRFCDFREREDIYFDETAVEDCIAFIANIKHFLGKSAGKPFILEPWQEFVIANVIGLKWKDSGYRVCRTMYLGVARKTGKDALIAAITLYLLVADGEMSGEIYSLANSREQSHIQFEYVTNFAKSLDPKGDAFKYYRNSIKIPSTNSKVEVLSSESAVLDGRNPSVTVLSEYHEFKDRKLLDVMISGMGMRTQPLVIINTTAGFHYEGPCHDMFMLGVETLAGVKKDDTSMYFMYHLDEGDDWTDERNFIKVQPNLGVTVTKDFMKSEVLKAKNDPTAMNGILVKTFNQWTQSLVAWLPPETVVKCMKDFKIEDFAGQPCYLGVDLSSNNDTTSLACLIPYENKYYFKQWCFLPEDTLKNHPNSEIYQKFVREGSLICTPGNICDFDYITKVIVDISQILSVTGIYYDPYNSGTWSIQCTELGFNMVPHPQGLAAFNNPTRQFEKWILSGDAVIQKSSLFVWCVLNCVLKEDWNSNRKPMKSGANAKIDAVIASIMATGGYLKNPMDNNNFEIFVL